jgi:hypothetical protein
VEVTVVVVISVVLIVVIAIVIIGVMVAGLVDITAIKQTNLKFEGCRLLKNSTDFPPLSPKPCRKDVYASGTHRTASGQNCIGNKNGIA